MSLLYDLTSIEKVETMAPFLRNNYGHDTEACISIDYAFILLPRDLVNITTSKYDTIWTYLT